MIPPGASAQCTERIIAEDTPRRECPQDGLVNSVGPVGLSSNAEKTLEPLEHMIHTQT